MLRGSLLYLLQYGEYITKEITMAKPKTITVQDVCKALVQQNPELAEIVNTNPGQSYKMIEALVKPMMRDISQATGTFVKTQALVWGIINEVEGTGTSTRLQLKL